MLRSPLLVVALAVGTGCTDDIAPGGQDSAAADLGPIDARPDVPALRDGAERIETPELWLEPHSEAIFCLVDSFPDDRGPLAVDWVAMYEHPTYGHHIQFNGLRTASDTFDVPDGTLVDCSDPDESMLVTSQVVNMNQHLTEHHGGEMVLPEGVAVPIQPGSRWIFEVHIVNPTERELFGQGVLDIQYVDPDAVTDWAAPWVFNDSGFALPPGEDSVVEVDCAWPQDATVLSLLGHMHERGLDYTVEMITPDGTSSLIHELPEWDLDWRYQPVVEGFDGGLEVEAGTRFVTRCHYFNDTESPLTFPDEMCVASGLYMPASETLACDVARDGHR